MIEILVGTRIRVRSHHWCRALSKGQVEEVKENGRYLIKFFDKGYGFNGGYYLLLDEKDFEIIEMR